MIGISKRSRYRGCLLGLAAGDAVGTAVEFQQRGSFPPVTDMVGGGPFELEPGQWTDDTSMALCLATSLLECRGFDAADQMARYCRWWKDGYLSSNGVCFDIGLTTRSALDRFEFTGEPYSGSTDPRAAGNGSIMRLAPVAMFYDPDVSKILHWTGESSRTTHGAAECIDACRYLGLVLGRALRAEDKESILAPVEPDTLVSESVRAIARGDYRDLLDDDVEGSGHVVRSLEAALWCFWTTDAFEEAVLRAVNLGDDADTTAAVCGQVAGAFYGESGIPRSWLSRLTMADTIRELADRLHDESG